MLKRSVKNYRQSVQKHRGEGEREVKKERQLQSTLCYTQTQLINLFEQNHKMF